MSSDIFQRRREKLIKKMAKGSLAILPTAPIRTRNNDVDFPFRPDSDFFYLTGFPEPQAVAVIRPHHPEGEYLLFCRERDPKMELWHGRRTGLDGAIENYGADKAYPIDQLASLLPEMLTGVKQIYYAIGMHEEVDPLIPAWMDSIRRHSRSGQSGPEKILALDAILHKMRQRKGKSEISAMRQAAQIAADGHRAMMRTCKTGQHEYQLEATFLAHCMNHGALRQAYPPIVGGGDNACILHYTENDARLGDGDLVLIDAGCEYQGYASDITRTFPVNGRFTPAQKALYSLVLKAQLAAIDKVKSGNSFNAPHEAAVRVLTKGLIELGIIKGPLSKAIKKESYKAYYMHRTSHWLGMDVHDVGPYKRDNRWIKLKPGMVLTIEPGIYIAPDTEGVDDKWLGIGIRIEDDVLVTAKGHEVLSHGAPKEISDIEALMAS